MRKYSKAVAFLVVVTLAMIMAAQSVPAAEYTVTTSVDFTGPYAVIMPPFETARKAFFAARSVASLDSC